MSNFFHFDLGFYAGSSKSAYKSRALKLDSEDDGKKDVPQVQAKEELRSQRSINKNWLA